MIRRYGSTRNSNPYDDCSVHIYAIDRRTPCTILRSTPGDGTFPAVSPVAQAYTATMVVRAEEKAVEATAGTAKEAQL